MKNLAILGSTGSVGQNTLEVVEENIEDFKIISLVSKSNIDLLEKQIKKFNPKVVAVFEEDKAKELQKRFSNRKILFGIEGLKEAACHEDVDLVVAAMSGNIGIIPIYFAIKEKKDIGLANKEILVSAGEIIIKLVKENGVSLLPIDSEHSAIFQCLKNENNKLIRRLILTASGGPFREFSLERLKKVKIEDALKHPTYKMGKKISVDSSTLMNKALEIIEAHYLFDIDPSKIDVVVHPESIIHSMVEFVDGSILSQMSEPNMKIPIQHALFYPQRKSSNIPSFDFIKNKCLTFYPPDIKKFPSLSFGYEALKIKKSMPCFMNSANEMLVERFFKKEISWFEILQKLEKLISSHKPQDMLDLSDIFEIDNLAKKQAQKI
jgi:1-deoxy-D-xylulose-5-phosphate reductoisomerase